MDDIVRSIARSFESLASEASDGEELIQGTAKPIRRRRQSRCGEVPFLR